jgi:uncharacterized repeat protein (TIGR02543 family)
MKRAALLICFFLIFITAACNGGNVAEAPAEPGVEESPKEEVFYTLSAGVYPEEGGLVYPTDGEYRSGTTIEVEAVPVPGYEFEGWSGASSISSPNLSLTMDGDKQLTAHFVLKLTPTPKATLTPTPEPTPAFKNPAEITLDDLGETYLVCGKVTNFGQACDPTGALKGDKVFAFIKLDNQFLITSKDWVFEAGWLGAGLCVEDKVDPLVNKAVFDLNKQEAEEGSDCYEIVTEEIVDGIPKPSVAYYCPAGSYFQPCPHCEDAHFNLPDMGQKFEGHEMCVK